MRGLITRLLIVGCFSIVVACASDEAGGYGAYGYFAPTPSGDGEFIGAFDDKYECEAAADAWASSRVVGGPVSAACYPVDSN